MADAPDEGAPPAPVVAVQSVEVPSFLSYLKRIVPVLLDDEDPNLKALQNAVTDKNHVEAVKKFLTDPQTLSLIVQRPSVKGSLTFTSSLWPVLVCCWLSCSICCFYFWVVLFFFILDVYDFC